MRRQRQAPVIPQGEEPQTKKIKVQSGLVGGSKGDTPLTEEKSSKKTRQLPTRLIDLTDSADKKWHETWCITKADTPQEKALLLNFPHPFRCVLVGPPNSGSLLLRRHV